MNVDRDLLIKNIHKVKRFELNTEYTTEVLHVSRDTSITSLDRARKIKSIVEERDSHIAYLEEAIEYITKNKCIHIREGLTLYVISEFGSWETLTYIYEILRIIEAIEYEIT
tara:strand:- start:634 stop:969 length:336 start_codon:yes stop_codon:yes gene_type:complete